MIRQALVFCVLGPLLPAQGLVRLDLPGDAANDRFGSAVVGLGDVDGDGIGDLAIGAELDDDGGSNAGALHIRSGVDGSVIDTILGQHNGDELGCSVDRLGDVDGDGVPDFIVGAWRDDTAAPSAGSALVCSGATRAPIYQTFGVISSRFGGDVAGGGDIDGDGIPDFLVGAHLSDTGGNNSGSVHAFSGGTGSLLFVAHGDGAEDMLGTAVAILDDLDGDGHAEFLAGAPGVDAHAGFFNTGRVRVYSGTDGTVLHDIPGPMSTNAQFGVSLAALDDVDGDGIGDFAVGAQGEVVTFGGGVGTVRIYSGSSGALIRTNAIDSNSVDSFGFAVSRAGDVDGDGIGDYVIGSPIDPFPGMTSVGRAWIYSGATGLVMVTLSGNASQSHFGDAVGAAGDIDGDGYAEVLIGSRLASVQGSFSGRAVVFSSTAATKYGLGFGGQQSLDLGWQPGAMPPAGQVVAGGAGAFAPGVISIATQSGFLAVGSPPIPLWIDLASIIVQEFFSFDASGNWAVASTLDLPGLAGASLFCQVADISGYPTVSNGLRFTFN